jgi:hypothetical protein
VLILLAKPVEQWRRESGTLLADKLADFRTRVEDAALARDMPPIAMLSVVEARIAALQALASRMREDGKAEPRETA